MKIVAVILVGFVAVEHILFLYLEMFLWTSPRGRKVFGTTSEQAANSKALAANQGLYNGFLATGLLWGLMHPVAELGWQIQVFFLTCVLVAAIYAGVTVKRSILFVQGVPAMMALLILILFYR